MVQTGAYAEISISKREMYKSGGNSQISPQLFQEGGKHETWHNDAFRSGDFKLIWNYAKIDVRTFPGGFSFSAHTFACKDENSNFSAFRFII